MNFTASSLGDYLYIKRHDRIQYVSCHICIELCIDINSIFIFKLDIDRKCHKGEYIWAYDCSEIEEICPRSLETWFIDGDPEACVNNATYQLIQLIPMIIGKSAREIAEILQELIDEELRNEELS